MVTEQGQRPIGLYARVAGRPTQLIYYKRPDLTDVKASKVTPASVEDNPALLALLGATIGIRSGALFSRFQ